MLASGPDLLRLLIVPALIWAAWKDHHTRRVSSHLWVTLIGIGLLAAFWEIDQIAPLHTVDELNQITRIVLVPPLLGSIAALLQSLGRLGAADGKAIFTLGLFFPNQVEYTLPIIKAITPIYEGVTPILAITIIMNSLLVGCIYLLLFWYRNLGSGNWSKKSLSTKQVKTDHLRETFGKLTLPQDAERETLDLDTLRMYLRWRDITISELQSNKTDLQNPNTISKIYQINNGAVHSERIELITKEEGEVVKNSNPSQDIDEGDNWGAEYFLNSIDHYAYGATPRQIRDGLNYISETESVRVHPNFPMMVPLLGGTMVGLTIGDVVVWFIIGIEMVS